MMVPIRCHRASQAQTQCPSRPTLPYRASKPVRLQSNLKGPQPGGSVRTTCTAAEPPRSGGNPIDPQNSPQQPNNPPTPPEPTPTAPAPADDVAKPSASDRPAPTSTPDASAPPPSEASSSAPSDPAAAGGDGAGGSQPQGPQRRLLQLAATYSKTEPHYLAAKARDKWWKRGSFPKIPRDSPDDAKMKDQPVKLWEKVAPLAVLFFFSSFNLTILQALKDAIMVTTAGAETLPYLASFVVLPASILFFGFYSRLVNSFSRQAVYYLAIAPFVAFYAFFATCVYPIADSLHLAGLFEAIAPLVPQGLHGLIRVVEYWSFSLFFCFAELWGSVVIAVLFWTLANDVCSVSEARTVYPLMGISANVALVAAGSYMKFMTKNVIAQGSTQVFLQTMVATIVVCAGLMGAAKGWIDLRILSKRDPADMAPPKAKKSKGSFAANVAVLKESPKIMNLALLVVCYAIAHRLFEFAWKGQLRVLFPTAQAYSGALADVSIYTGYMTIALMLCGKFVFEHLGWGTAALATPTVMLLSGASFFGLSMAYQYGWIAAGPALLMAGAVAGAITQVFARSSKFSLFDPAKEMVYIEMTKEEKSKGKAAVDLMGSQLGKSGASWIIQGALILFGSATACLPVLSTCYLVVIGVWMKAAVSLEKQMAAVEQARVEAPEGGGADGGAPGGGTGVEPAGPGPNGAAEQASKFPVTLPNPSASPA